MTTKADFTPEEWDLVREGPPTAGMVALTADKGGSFRETWALAKAYAEARKEHGESELLDALVSEKPDVKRYKTPEELESAGLGKLTEAVNVLEQKAGGEQVSEGEKAAIEKIAASLYPSGST